MRYLPQALVATFAVVVCPLLIVSSLRAVGLVRSSGMSIALGVALSLGASVCGNAIWRSRSGSGDILFGELLLWGWVRRIWIERQLKSALRLLDGIGQHEGLNIERRRELLTKLAGALEARDPYTHGHSRRVARTAAMIATRMGLPRAAVAKVRTAAMLHDVGKVNTPLAVLHKPGRLTDDEFDIIKQHPVDGASMVSTLADTELTAMVRHHHERLDGTGYPDRLSGELIPLGARIIAVADTFDAITSARPYRSASPHKKAIGILAAEAGKQLDPGAVRAFDSYYAGRWPLALWSGLVNAVQPVVSWVAGELAAAGSGSVAPMVALATLTGVVGGATADSHPFSARPPRSADRAAVIQRAPAGRLGHIRPSSVTGKSQFHGSALRRARASSVTAGHGGSAAGRGGAATGKGDSSVQRGSGAATGSGALSTTSSGTGTPNAGGGAGGGAAGGGVTTGGGGRSGTGVTVGGTGVTVGGTGVSTGSSGTGVTVGGTGVSTGSSGTGVTVSRTGVTVGGTGVSVGG